MGGGGGGGGVKVVIINTQYVETDAVSFKSVVQKLTGKVDPTTTVAAKPRRHCQSGNEAAAVAPPVVERVLSFKDFDRMLKELPPLDELYTLFADN